MGRPRLSNKGVPKSVVKNRERTRRQYYKKKQQEQKDKEIGGLTVKNPDWPDDPIGALAEWSTNVLKVPFGHELEGKPMTLPQYGIDFLKDAICHRESCLCIGRKNAKSAIIAVYLLGRLIGPLRQKGYRACVCSVTAGKAAELKMQMFEICRDSNLLEEVNFVKSPVPGYVHSEWSRVDILSADKSSGHASGFNEVFIDETGLLHERDRAYLNGIKSSISARNGKIIHLSIEGDGPFIPEMLSRHQKGDKTISVHHYTTPPNYEINDEEGWKLSNPGLGTIKSISYMRDTAEACRFTPADEPSFRAFDLNQHVDAASNPIITLSQYKRCTVESEDDLPERSGPIFAGTDLGESTSMCAASFYWPDTQRLEVYGAFPDTPNLSQRGQADGVGNLYERMEQEGTLTTFPGEVTPIPEFLAWVFAKVDSANIVSNTADRYREKELGQFFREADLYNHIQLKFLPVGAGAMGSLSVRTFQRLTISGKLKYVDSLILSSAIRESKIRLEDNRNVALEKARKRGRIDVLAAALLAVGESVNSGYDAQEQDIYAGWR